MASLTGCRGMIELPQALKSKQKVEAAAETPTLTDATIKDVELAKIILKPKRHELSGTNDPFKPLLTGLDSSADDQIGADVLKDIQYLGSIKMGDQISALLKVRDDKGVYKVNDQIKQWVISEIDQEYVLLKKDSVVLKLIRGDK